MNTVLEEYTSAAEQAENTEVAFRSGRFSRLIAETFGRSVRTSRTSIMLTSARSGAGVSFFCCTLAAELAREGASVLLVDAHALTGASGSSPLVVSAACRRVASRSLWVLGSKEMERKDASHPLRTTDDTCAAILRELEQRFTYVLIDAPALAFSRDAEMLSSAVYGTVLVVRSGANGESDLRQAQNKISTYGGRVLGTVFNARQ